MSFAIVFITLWNFYSLFQMHFFFTFYQPEFLQTYMYNACSFYTWSTHTYCRIWFSHSSQACGVFFSLSQKVAMFSAKTLFPECCKISMGIKRFAVPSMKCNDMCTKYSIAKIKGSTDKLGWKIECVLVVCIWLSDWLKLDFKAFKRNFIIIIITIIWCLRISSSHSFDSS